MPKLQLIAVKMDGKTVESFKLADITAPIRTENGLLDKSQTLRTEWVDATIVADIVLNNKATLVGIQSNGLFLEGSNGSFNRYANLKVVEPGKKYPLTVFERVNISGVDGATVLDVDGRILTVSMDKLVKYAEAVGISNGKVVEHNGTKFISSIRGEYNRVGVKPSYETLPAATEVEGEVHLANALKRGGRQVPGYWPEGAKLRDEKLNLTVEEKLIVAYKAIQNWNFFIYSLLSQLTTVPLNPNAMAMPTMGVSLDMKLVYNPHYVLKLSLEELIFTLLHETYHILFSHPARIAEMKIAAKQRGTKTGLPLKEEMMMYNIAADLFVNKYVANQFDCLCTQIEDHPHLVKTSDPFVTNTSIQKWTRGVKQLQMQQGLVWNDKVDCEKDSIETLFKDLIEEKRRELERQREEEEKKRQQQRSNQSSDEDDDDFDDMTDNDAQDDSSLDGDQSGSSNNPDEQDDTDDNDAGQSEGQANSEDQEDFDGQEDFSVNWSADDTEEEDNSDEDQQNLGQQNGTSGSGNDDCEDEDYDDEDSNSDAGSGSGSGYGDEDEQDERYRDASGNGSDSNEDESDDDTDSIDGPSFGGNANEDEDGEAVEMNDSQGTGGYGQGQGEDSDEDGDFDDLLDDAYSQLSPRDMTERREDIASKFEEYEESIRENGTDLDITEDNSSEISHDAYDISQEEYQQQIEDLKMWKDKLKSTVLKAEVASQQRGLSLSAAEKRLVDSIIKPVPINWQILLKRMFNMAAVKKNSFKKPSRRPEIARNVVLPGKTKKEPEGLKKIIFAIDTSGSVGDRELKYVLGLMRTLTDKYEVDVEIMWWSTRVNGIEPIKDTMDLLRAYRNVASDGGTCATNMFKYITNPAGPYRGKQIHGLVIFTDGYIENVELKYKRVAKNILWMIHSRAINTFTAPFGTTCYVNADKD